MQTQVARICLHLLEKKYDMKNKILEKSDTSSKSSGYFTQKVQDKLDTLDLSDNILENGKIESPTGIISSIKYYLSFLPIFSSENSTDGLTYRKKLAYYYSMMVTCDKTVHYRNILMGIPTMYTGSGSEDGDEEELSLKVGYSWHPNIDPIEKLYALLNIEFQSVYDNNTKLTILLANAELERTTGQDKYAGFYFMKFGRGAKPVKTKMELESSKKWDVSDIIDEIGKLTNKAKEKGEEFKGRIQPSINDEDIKKLQKEILTEFRKFKCPQFIFPCPSIDVGGEMKSQPGHIVTIPELLKEKKINDELDGIRTILKEQLSAFTSSGRSDQSVVPSLYSASGGGGGDTDRGDDEYSITYNEKYLLRAIIKDYKPNDANELYIMYCHVVDRLEHYKNLDSSGNFYTWEDDDEYAVKRMTDALTQELGDKITESVDPQPPSEVAADVRENMKHVEKKITETAETAERDEGDEPTIIKDLLNQYFIKVNGGVTDMSEPGRVTPQPSTPTLERVEPIAITATPLGRGEESPAPSTPKARKTRDNPRSIDPPDKRDRGIDSKITNTHREEMMTEMIHYLIHHQNKDCCQFLAEKEENAELKNTRKNELVMESEDSLVIRSILTTKKRDARIRRQRHIVKNRESQKKVTKLHVKIYVGVRVKFKFK